MKSNNDFTQEEIDRIRADERFRASIRKDIKLEHVLHNEANKYEILKGILK